MLKLADLKKELKNEADAKRAKLLQRFFKTAPGQYGYGDVFLGIPVPLVRQIAKKYHGLKLKEAEKLLHSKEHEARLTALLILVDKFEKGENTTKIFKLYLKNAKYVNNWDLVDLSVHKIVGAYLYKKPKTILYKLARSKNLWEKRMAIIATFYFLRYNQVKETLKIASLLLNDSHDLIHKAVGWALREVGKKDLKAEEDFLRKHCKTMPRTMLRYAIERFPADKRKRYLAGRV